MISSKNFEEYIHFLRTHFNNVLEYKELTGTVEPSFAQIGDDLFDDDPFVVFNASLAAAAIFNDKGLYH